MKYCKYINIVLVPPTVMYPTEEKTITRRYDNTSTELICDVISKPMNVVLNWTKNGPYEKEDYVTASLTVSGNYYYDVKQALRSNLYFNLAFIKNSCSDLVKFDGYYTCMVFQNNNNLLNSSSYIIHSFCEILLIN